MKKYLALLSLLIIISRCYSQDMIITKDGKVTKVPETAGKNMTGKKTLFFIDSTGLRSWEENQKREVMNSLWKSFHTTATVLKQPESDLSKFYNWLWRKEGGAAAIAGHYDSLSAGLMAHKPAFALQRNSAFYILDSILNCSFSSRNRLFVLDKSKSDRNNYVVTLKAKDLANQFLLNLYDAAFNYPPNRDFTIISQEQYDELRERANRQREALTAALKMAEKQVTLDILTTLYTTERSFAAYSDRDFLFKLLRTPWVKTWLWKNNGEIKLNPFPFTDEELLTNTPSFDTKKADYLKRYVDTTLERRIVKDYPRNIATFIQDVNYSGKEKELFIDSSAYRKSLSLNKEMADKTQLVTRTINEIRIPFQSPGLSHIQYFYEKQSGPAPEDKVPAIFTDTRLVTSIYNVPKGHSIHFNKTKETGIKDESETQSQINDAMGSIASLQALMTPAVPVITSLLAGTVKKVQTGNRQIAASLTQKSINLFSYPDFSNSVAEYQAAQKSHNKGTDPLKKYFTSLLFWAGIDSEIINNPLVSSSIINFANLSPLASDSATLAKITQVYDKKVLQLIESGNRNSFKKLTDEVLAAYWHELISTRIGPAVVNALRSDSVYISLALKTINTVPPRTVKETEDPEPQYKTWQYPFKTDDSTRSYTYAINDITAKDSSTIVNLSYKTGRRHYIQVSAGLAYTFPEVKTNTLDQTGGQISISTSSQQYRFYAGIHIYPAGLFLQDKFWGTKKTVPGRINIMAGVGLPKAIENFYLGVGYDLGPGIRINTGVHFHSYNQYVVSNDQVTDDSKIYKAHFPFVSLGIDPAGLVKALNIFNL